MEKDLRKEMHDMSEKIYRLQEKSEKLTNGQRYAAINEIEKSIQPLRSDLRHLEHELYSQNSDKKIIAEYKERDFPLHKHDYYEILVYVDGEGHIMIENQTFSIKKGTRWPFFR